MKFQLPWLFGKRPKPHSSPSQVLKNQSDSDIAIAYEVMQEAIVVISELSNNFSVNDIELPNLNKDWDTGFDVQTMLSDPVIQTWLRDTILTLPKGLRSTFEQSSSIIAQILSMFGVMLNEKRPDLLSIISDPVSMNLMIALADMSKDTEELENNLDAGAKYDPMGTRQVIMTEMSRRRLMHNTPFGRTLTTLMGDDALLWLTSDSKYGIHRLQPHEFSRTRWCKIWEIETQLAIEQELQNLQPEIEHIAKIIIAMCWTLVALASFLPPAIFLGEQIPYLSSMRNGHLTVSVGMSTHTIISLQPHSLIHLVHILSEGLMDPLITAADLMWIGAGLVRVQEVSSGHTHPVAFADDKYEIFLSHRGIDSKALLAEATHSLGKSHGVFLDCLTLPRGVINRKFVFGSLARSENIIIVDTKNFNSSAWCRKEAWFAEILAKRGLSKTEHMSISEAIMHVKTVAQTSTEHRIKQQLQYPIAQRVMRDLDYWARTPNLHSLRETGNDMKSLEPIQTIIESENLPEDPIWLASIGSAVRESFFKVVKEAPNAEPFDLWATALQYALAAFTLTSSSRSKMEVRGGVERLLAALKSATELGLHREPVFISDAPGYLAIIAAAAAIDLAGYELDPRMSFALQLALGKSAVFHKGLILLDLRSRGQNRMFYLSFIATLLRANLGAIGIVQSPTDEVHMQRIDNLPLEVLPCITLYPGMEDPFDSLAKNFDSSDDKTIR